MAAFRKSPPTYPSDTDHTVEDEDNTNSNRSSPSFADSEWEDEVEDNVDSVDEGNLQEAGKWKSSTGRKKEKKGRKANWKERHLDDMVDVIVSNEHYKNNLIFANTKNSRNGEVYEKVLAELQERYVNIFPFNAEQIRNKFKKCVSDCKKLALTVKTGTGIKRVQEEKGYGAWFNQLFPLVQSRDSCNPDLAIEPSTSRTSAGGRDKSRKRSTETSENSESNGELSCESDKSVFVPVKKRAQRKSRSGILETVNSFVGIMKTVVENDPAKDVLKFFQEENNKAREHEMRMMQLFMSSRPLSPNQQASHAGISFTHPYPDTSRGELQPSYGSPSCSSVLSNDSVPHYYYEERTFRNL